MRGAYRKTDPDTSKEAAPDVSRLEGEVYAILRMRPSTAEEVAVFLSKPLQSITPRIAPLVRKGFIYDTGERRPGASGRSRMVLAASSEVVPKPKSSRKLSDHELANIIQRHTKFGDMDWVVDVVSIVRELESRWGIK